MRGILVLLGVSVAALPADAATMYLTGGVSIFRNGQVSEYRGQRGLIEERFKTGTSGACVQTHPTAVSFSSLGLPTGPLPTSAGLVRGAYTGQALPPGSTSDSIRDGIPIADQSCYLAAPNPTSGAPLGQIAADIGLAATSPILYFGFYWGGMAPDQTLTLLSRPDANGARAPITVDGLSDANGVITGNRLLALFGHPSPFNSYVAFRFGAADNFGTVIFGAPSPGFVVDNIAFSTSDFLATPPAQNQHTLTAGAASAAQRADPQPALLVIPEPPIAGLLGLAFGPLALSRRRRHRRA